MEQDNKNRKNEPVYSKKLRAGRRRTYFFDVRPTRSNDYYLTITESKKRYNEDGYDRHKIFLYKEDFNKFMEALSETVDHVKTELLPEYDFDEFSRRYDEEGDDYEHMPDNEDVGATKSSKTEGQENVEKEQTPESSPEPPAADDQSDEDDHSEDEDLKWD